MPIKDFKINGEQDPKDLKYQPKDNPFDRPSFEICKCLIISHG